MSLVEVVSLVEVALAGKGWVSLVEVGLVF